MCVCVCVCDRRNMVKQETTEAMTTFKETRDNLVVSHKSGPRVSCNHKWHRIYVKISTQDLEKDWGMAIARSVKIEAYESASGRVSGCNCSSAREKVRFTRGHIGHVQAFSTRQCSTLNSLVYLNLSAARCCVSV